jgi:outer membrane protein OmpA-like peptidoglycan-associated protein
MRGRTLIRFTLLLLMMFAAALLMNCAVSYAQVPSGSAMYWAAKAQCWADLAATESAQGDSRGTPSIAQGNSQRIRAAIDAGVTPAADAELPLFTRRLLPSADARTGRPGWRSDIEAVEAVLEKYRSSQCRTQLSACLEVAQASVWENMQETEGARWNHGRPEIDKAVSLAQQAAADLAVACDTAQAALPTPLSVQADEEKQEVLLADVLFDFDSAALTANGKKAVSLLVERLKKTSASRSWTVMGHADRFGSDEHNKALSLQRARVVAAFIEGQESEVRAVPLSSGSSRPVVDCPGELTAETVACLAPNRRVVVRAIE